MTSLEERLKQPRPNPLEKSAEQLQADRRSALRYLIAFLAICFFLPTVFSIWTYRQHLETMDAMAHEEAAYQASLGKWQEFITAVKKSDAQQDARLAEWMRVSNRLTFGIPEISKTATQMQVHYLNPEQGVE